MFKMTSSSGIVIWIFTTTCILHSALTDTNSGEADIGCMFPWEQLHQSCVLFKTNRPFKTWQDARASCLSIKADLLSINDKLKNDKLFDVMRPHITGRSYIKWWVGLRAVNGTWQWVDNDEPYAKIPEWAPDAGSLVNSDHSLVTDRCGLIEHQGYLLDEKCSLKRPFICEQIKITPPPTSTTTVSTTSTTVLTTETPYPIPTPDTVTPNTRLTTSQSTKEPVEKSTVTNPSKDTGQITEKSTQKPTDKPVTARPTDTPTDKATETSTDTGKPTDNPSENRTDKHTGKPTYKHTGKLQAKHTGKLTDKPTGNLNTGRPTDAPNKMTKKPRVEKEVFEVIQYFRWYAWKKTTR